MNNTEFKNYLSKVFSVFSALARPVFLHEIVIYFKQNKPGAAFGNLWFFGV